MYENSIKIEMMPFSSFYFPIETHQQWPPSNSEGSCELTLFCFYIDVICSLWPK